MLICEGNDKREGGRATALIDDDDDDGFLHLGGGSVHVIQGKQSLFRLEPRRITADEAWKCPREPGVSVEEESCRLDGVFERQRETERERKGRNTLLPAGTVVAKSGG